MHKQPAVVAVIADTHVKHLNELPPELLSALRKADFIIHLGDFTSRELMDDLGKLGNLYGISGNHDDTLLHQDLKEVEVLDIGGKRLGLFHGFVFPFGSQKRMKASFKEHGVDAILYGHTHFSVSRFVDGVFLFNPGSVTGHFPAYYGSFGLLTLDGTIAGQIIPVKRLDIASLRFLNQLWSLLFGAVIRFVETWPYMDVLRYTADIGLALKRPFFSLEKFFLWKKAAP